MPADTDPASFATRLARCRFRAWHRGTREADYMIGCFFDRYHVGWTEESLAWFEALLDEDDADIMAWALGALEAPDHLCGPELALMRKLDYVSLA